MKTTVSANLLPAVIDIARRASAAIMPFFRTEYAVHRKEDRSPVTAADHAAEAVIKPALQRLLREVPVVAEESVAAAPAAEALARMRFWLVDPLDGTKEFVSGRDEFTVNIALIENERPVLGVMAVPARDQIYAAANGEAFVQRGSDAPSRIKARVPPPSGLVVAHSRSHADRDKLEQFLAAYPVAERIISGSALKLGWIAEGAVDLYPRLGPTMEWDTAAGHAILDAAGGSITDAAGEPLRYGKPGFRNPPFIARGRMAGAKTGSAA
jgi:3'(2'), 5'-bisphosphate nucleotidase